MTDVRASFFESDMFWRPGCLTKLADISGGQVQTGVDNSECLSRLADIWRTYGGHLFHFRT